MADASLAAQVLGLRIHGYSVSETASQLGIAAGRVSELAPGIYPDRKPRCRRCSRHVAQRAIRYCKPCSTQRPPVRYFDSEVADCTGCGQRLPLAAFSPRRHGRGLGLRPVRYHCRRCEYAGLLARNAAAPEKKLARQLVWLALRFGDLQRAPCEDCGSAKVDGHHEDYSQPLIVRWLCRSCHLSRDRAAA